MFDSTQEYVSRSSAGQPRHTVISGPAETVGTPGSQEYSCNSQSVRMNARSIMFKRTSFQSGSLKKEKRKRGPDVWIYRFREIGPDGLGRKPKVIVGTVEEYPTQALARRAVEALGLGINNSKHQAVKPFTMEDLIIH